MDHLHLFLVAIILLAGNTAGQKVAFLYNESVYTIPYFPQTYDNATDSCSQDHDGDLAYVEDPSQSILALGFRDFQTTEKIWTTDNIETDYEDYGTDDSFEDGFHDEHQCTSFQLSDGSILKEDCSLEYYSVCKAKAWRYNISTYENYNYALSKAKLRYTDAAHICTEKGTEDGVEGSLVTIMSEEENNFLKDLIQDVRESENTGNNVEYFIHSDNPSGSYSNWLTPRTSDDKIECTIISDTENPGKWQVHKCYDYENFICKWPAFKPTTQASPETTTMKSSSSKSTAATTAAVEEKDTVTTATSTTTQTQQEQMTAKVEGLQKAPKAATDADIVVTEGGIESTTGGSQILRQEMMMTMILAAVATLFSTVIFH